MAKHWSHPTAAQINILCLQIKKKQQTRSGEHSGRSFQSLGRE